jgi:hypothetical protein
MEQTVVHPDEMTDHSDLDDVEWEMCCSDREVAGGFVPFANLDMMQVLAGVRAVSKAPEHLPPSRVKRLVRCPECQGEDLIPVIAGRKMNFFCRDCTLCWHMHGDDVTRVNPSVCPGCELVTTACFEHLATSSAAAS